MGKKIHGRSDPSKIDSSAFRHQEGSQIAFFGRSEEVDLALGRNRIPLPDPMLRNLVFLDSSSDMFNLRSHHLSMSIYRSDLKESSTI